MRDLRASFSPTGFSSDFSPERIEKTQWGMRKQFENYIELSDFNLLIFQLILRFNYVPTFTDKYNKGNRSPAQIFHELPGEFTIHFIFLY